MDRELNEITGVERPGATIINEVGLSTGNQPFDVEKLIHRSGRRNNVVVALLLAVTLIPTYFVTLPVVLGHCWVARLLRPCREGELQAGEAEAVL